MKRHDQISIRNASENNLRWVSLDIPKNKLVVVTGVSGSGKSSLVFDVIFREAERRYLATFTTYARQFLQKTRRPRVESVTGLSPAIAIDQHAITRNPRSTVGTLTEIYDYLRLLYARVGIPDTGINRSLFSFNSPIGACPACKGLGVEDRLDPALMISDPKKTLREGAMVITAPNGYIIYSQVTLDVLNQVCEAEGFSIDIPWEELTPDQQHVILYGSEKLEVPYGKHPLESRMRWSGITAKPREMGYYKGIIPVMETILKRERNKNILRFVRTSRCSQCQGKRLNPKALSVTIHGKSIAQLAQFQLDELRQTLNGMTFPASEEEIAHPIIEKISSRIGTLEELGLSYLTLDRESTTLSTGEAQRIRLSVQIGMELQGLLYILDEPSVGLHPIDSMRIIRALKTLRDKGNSVIVVEHEEAFIRHADWLIDLGPGAGSNGGEALLNMPISELSNLSEQEISKNQTLQYLFRLKGTEARSHSSRVTRHASLPSPPSHLTLTGITHHNLRNIDVTFKLQALNVVTGVSGAGKSSLVNDVVGKRLPGTFREIHGWESIDKVIAIDQSPIGKTSRSNPATYTGLFDHIRDLFASLSQSKERGYSKSRFSFNTAGGRCEGCKGGGFHQIGMHFLGNVEVICSTCLGQRFDEETLEVKHLGKNIAEVLDLTISEAITFFDDQPVILRYLNVLEALGLGYLHLGQRSSTLSGGEAQRVKLATELSRPAASHTLYLLDEPTTGLHQADVARLLEALEELVKQQHTVIVIEHHQALILSAEHVIDLGPGSGKNGGTVVATGTPQTIMETSGSLTGRALVAGSEQWAVGSEQWAVGINKPLNPLKGTCSLPFRGGLGRGSQASHITFTGVTTNNLKGVDFSIPYNKITVITGISGSGKSSLAFDTLYAEGRNRFLESFSSYARAQMGIKEKPGFEKVTRLTPTFAVDQRDPGNNPRSTVGTYTGIYDILRLLFARFAVWHPEPLNPLKGTYALPFRGGPGRGHPLSGIRHPVLSTLFSFNEQQGACPRCDGLGSVWVCSSAKLVTHPERSLLAGALDGTKTGRFYGEEFGQYVSILKAVGERHAIDYSKRWSALTAMEKQLAMEGTGDEAYDVSWHFRRKERTGEHHFKGKWIGFAGLVNQEYTRKHADHRGEEMKAVMEEICCPECQGKRLNRKALSYLIQGKDIAQISSLPVIQLEKFLRTLPDNFPEPERDPIVLLTKEILERLKMLLGMGLGYISLSRPVDSLSGGEFQRIKLAGQMGTGLTGITYVLDEPTAGLHPVDTGNLLNRIEMLREAGNTIVMVEHDPEVIRRADLVIDMGPGAGKEGGEIIACGTPAVLQKDPRSVTGQYLKRNRLRITSRNRFEGYVIPDPGSRIPDPKSGIWQPATGISIQDATLHNLDHLSVSIPTGGLVAITGISGSGKSTLMDGVLYESWVAKQAHGCKEISGFQQFDRVISVRKKRHFSESRGTVATFSGIFDLVRDLFARSPEAKKLKLTKSHFSFLSPQSGCDLCNGSGEIRISMDFMADVKIICEKCHGKRYQEQVLNVRINGNSIADILEMTFREAGEFFAHCITNSNVVKINSGLCITISEMLKPLTRIGLGYLILGQSLETLSGGEAQRLTLARELIHPAKGASLFLFNEPSSGLHPADLPALLMLFDQLVDQGHSVILIEHNPEAILHSDWIIDMGPGGGDQGGKVVASGNPDEILQQSGSLTGKYLADQLA